MSLEDLQRMGKHIINKQEQKARFTENAIPTKRTWSTKNFKENAKKLGAGFGKAQDSLRTAFPGLADGSFNRQIEKDFGMGGGSSSGHHSSKKHKGKGGGGGQHIHIHVGRY